MRVAEYNPVFLRAVRADQDLLLRIISIYAEPDVRFFCVLTSGRISRVVE